MTVPSGQPSPRPWQVCGCGKCHQIHSLPADVMIAVALTAHDKNYTMGDGATHEAAKANAELIVEAVNGWDALRGERDRLRAALEPFAAKEECDIGFLVGEDEEHTRNCAECQRILVARAAFRVGAPVRPGGGCMKVVWQVGILFGGCANETDYWVEAVTPQAALRLGEWLARRDRDANSDVVRMAPRICSLVEVGSVDAR